MIVVNKSRKSRRGISKSPSSIATMAELGKLEAKEAEIGSWARTAKDLVSGAAGGVAQVLIGEF